MGQTLCMQCNGQGIDREKSIAADKIVYCTGCGGSALETEKKKKTTCVRCSGLGIRHVGLVFPRPETCQYCGGCGKVCTKGEARTMANPEDEQNDWKEMRASEVAVPTPKEAVKHPQHYNTGKFEVIDVIEDWQLGFNDGNAVKYIGRHRHKVSPKEDLKKALWYIARELVSMHAVSPDELATIVQTVRK